MAEATGSIISIGEWVLEQSCQKLALWRGQSDKQHLRISVNVSPVQFRSVVLVPRVKQTLDKTGAPASKLRFELTENMLAEDIDFVVQQMNRLRELGVSISLDDFGTGYASLAYLTRLPLDELKVDRMFIRSLDVEAEEALLAQSIITLGQSMNLVAEGVETELAVATILP
nr:EAL domain-containing protein [Aliidiomarina taiwanensis]